MLEIKSLILLVNKKLIFADLIADIVVQPIIVDDQDMLQKTILIVAVASLGSSCVKKNSSNSDTKYAQLDDFGGFGLAEVLPNQTVTICSDESTNKAADLVKKSILEWAAPIGRDKYIKVDTGCSSKADVKVTLTTSDSNGTCEGGVAAYTYPESKGAFTIVYCSQQFVTAVDINIHEVGHIWMQCDRYGLGDLSQAKFGANCSSTYTDNKEVSSAMMAGGPSHPQKVTQDDANSMKALGLRTDISANEKWKNIANNSTPTPSGNPSSPKDNKSTPPLDDAKIIPKNDNSSSPANSPLDYAANCNRLMQIPVSQLSSQDSLSKTFCLLGSLLSKP